MRACETRDDEEEDARLRKCFRSGMKEYVKMGTSSPTWKYRRWRGGTRTNMDTKPYDDTAVQNISKPGFAAQTPLHHRLRVGVFQAFYHHHRYLIIGAANLRVLVPCALARLPDRAHAVLGLRAAFGAVPRRGLGAGVLFSLVRAVG